MAARSRTLTGAGRRAARHRHMDEEALAAGESLGSWGKNSWREDTWGVKLGHGCPMEVRRSRACVAVGVVMMPSLLARQSLLLVQCVWRRVLAGFR